MGAPFVTLAAAEAGRPELDFTADRKRNGGGDGELSIVGESVRIFSFQGGTHS